MKFSVPCTLYYVCPFIFNIEKVKVNMGVQESDGIYYIDQTGAYLKEENLFDNIFDAQEHAFKILTTFYYKKTHEILYHNPEIREDM